MKAIGIVLAGGKRSSLDELTYNRNVAAMPIGGSYRAIDFVLSNLSTSGIKKVAVISQHSTGSLTDHISSSKWWDFGRKKTGLFVLTPHMLNADTFSFKGTADAIYQNIDFLKKSNEPYVVITAGDKIAKMDFDKAIKYHESKGADITLVCKDFKNYDLKDYGVVALDGDNKVIDFEEKPLDPQHTTASLGTYIIGRELLINLLEELETEGRYSLVTDIIIRYRRKLNIYAYIFDGYWRALKDIKELYNVNMDFLNSEIREVMFKQYPPIYTKAKDEPPAKFSESCDVTNSIISGGDIINGTIDHSVLFRKVFVGEDSIIRNSIIMEGCTIGRGVVIENAILDKQVYVSDGQRIIGTKEKIVVLPKKSIL